MYSYLVGEPCAAEFEGPLHVAAGTAGNLHFGGLLKDMRERRGLNPQQLADHASVHVSFVRGIERGAQAPSMETARLLLACFQEQERIEWTGGGSYDLLVRDPESGRDVAFAFKAKVKGQNRRTDIDAATLLKAMASAVEAMTVLRDFDAARFAKGMEPMVEAIASVNRIDTAGLAKAMLPMAEAMTRVSASVGPLGALSADVVGPGGDSPPLQSAPGDDARLARVVRLLGVADDETLSRVERLLSGGTTSDAASA